MLGKADLIVWKLEWVRDDIKTVWGHSSPSVAVGLLSSSLGITEAPEQSFSLLASPPAPPLQCILHSSGKIRKSLIVLLTLLRVLAYPFTCYANGAASGKHRWEKRWAQWQLFFLHAGRLTILSSSLKGRQQQTGPWSLTFVNEVLGIDQLSRPLMVNT